MQIILLEQIKGLGKLGDIVEVKSGYARNFLIPKAKAKRATKDNLKDFELRRKEYEALQIEKLDAAHKAYAKINDQSFEFKAKASVDGKLFGSISELDIVKEIEKLGIKVVKHDVIMPHGHIKHIGEFTIEVNVHAELTAKVNVNVIPE